MARDCDFYNGRERGRTTLDGDALQGGRCYVPKYRDERLTCREQSDRALERQLQAN